MDLKTAVIVNPRSAAGRAARLWPALAKQLRDRLGPFETHFTQSPGHGILLARELLKQGFDFIIAAGGDGTANEIVNGFILEDAPVRPDARLGLLPLGTGGDYRRSLGIGPSVEDSLAALAAGATLQIDVGKAKFVGADGTFWSRYFANLLSFGMGGEVAMRSKNALGALGGRLAFLWATFAVFASYRGRRISLELDGAPAERHFITNVALGNGSFHGGGMHPCPRAVLNDGLLEVTVIDYLGMFELARDVRVLYSNDVYRHPKAHHFRARRVVATCDEPASIEVDGEPLGRLPLEVSVLQWRLNVVVPASSPLLAISQAPLRE